MSEGEHYQVNGGGYDEKFFDQGVGHVSTGEYYQNNGGAHHERFCDRGVGGPNVGINSMMCALPIKSIVGVKLQSHNMFAHMASGGSCSLISKKLVNDLGFWPWIQMHRNIITNKDGQGKRGGRFNIFRSRVPK